MLDEREFLSPCGMWALSRYHAEHPDVFQVGGQEYRVPYLQAESDTGMFGGNSNWRGPVWIIARAKHLFATSTAEQSLELGKVAGITEVGPARRGQGGGGAPSRLR
jgi:hypothetical protein